MVSCFRAILYLPWKMEKALKITLKRMSIFNVALGPFIEV